MDDWLTAAERAAVNYARGLRRARLDPEELQAESLRRLEELTCEDFDRRFLRQLRIRWES